MIFAIVMLYILVVCLIIFAVAAWQEIREIVRVSKKSQNDIKEINKHIKDLGDSYDIISLQHYWITRRMDKQAADVKKLGTSVEKFSLMAIRASNHAAFVNTVWEHEERKAKNAKHESKVTGNADEVRQEPVSKQ